MAFRAGLCGVALLCGDGLGGAGELSRWQARVSHERPETSVCVNGKELLKLSLAAYPQAGGAARVLKHSVVAAPATCGGRWEARGVMGVGKGESAAFDYTCRTQTALDDHRGAIVSVSYEIEHQANLMWRAYGPVVNVTLPRDLAAGGWVAEGVNGDEVRFGDAGGNDYLPPAKRSRFETTEGVVEISVDGGYVVGGPGRGEVSVFSLSRDPATKAGQRQTLRVAVALPAGACVEGVGGAGPPETKTGQ